MRQRARTASNQSLEIRCTYEIAEEFEALDNLGQAMAAYDELSISSNEQWSKRAQLALVRLEARILSAAALGEQADEVVSQEIQGYARRLLAIAGDPEAALGAEALLALARIQKDFRRPLRALDSISDLERGFPDAPEVVARGRMLRAEIFRARGDEEAFQQELLAITQDYADRPMIRQNAVRRFLNSIEEEEAEPRALVERLRQAMTQHADLGLLQSLGALRIARAYKRMDLPHAQRAELEWVIVHEPEQSALRATAMERLLLQLAESGSLDEVEQLVPEYEAQAARSLPQKEQDAARGRIIDELLRRAAILRDQKNTQGARATYEYLTRIYPDVLGAHYGRISLAEDSDIPVLISEYEQEDSGAAHYALALLRLRGGGVPDLAEILEEDIDPALRAAPTNSAVHQLRGYVYQINETVYRQRGVGGIEEAIQAYQLALLLSADSPRQSRRQSELYAALGNAFMNFTPPNYERAAHYYRLYMDSAPVFENQTRELALRERMARAAFHAGESRRAAAHAGRGAVLAAALGRAALHDRLLSYEAMCLQETGDHEAAVARLKEVEGSPRGRVRTSQRNRILRNLAYNRYQIGARIEALANLKEGLEILQDPSVEFRSARADTQGFSADASEEAFGFSRKGELRLNYTYAGQIREELGELAQAVELQKQKLALFPRPENEKGEEALKYHSRVGIGWNRIARLEYARSNFVEAAQALRLSLANATQAQQLRGQALALGGLLRSLLVSDGELGAADITQIGSALDQLVDQLIEQRAKGLPVDYTLLARIYHTRAMLGATQSGSPEPWSMVDVLRDFEASAYAFTRAEEQSAKGLGPERLSVQLNELAYLRQIGFTGLALARADQLRTALASQGLRCLAWHLPLIEGIGDKEARGRLLDELRSFPPGLCTELSAAQLRDTYERIFERLLAATDDAGELSALLELRSELLLAADFGGRSWTFADAGEQARATKIEEALGKARASGEALQHFRIVEGSLENREALASLQSQWQEALGGAKLAIENARAADAALARLYGPVVPAESELASALEQSALIRITPLEGRGLLLIRLPGSDEPVSAFVDLPGGSPTPAAFDEWLNANLFPWADSLGSADGIYVIADDALAALPWQRLARALGKDVAVSQIGSLAHLVIAHQRRNANKGRGMLVARTDAGSETEIAARYGWLESFHGSLAEEITGLRGFYFRDNTAQELAATLSDPTSQYHFLQVMAPLQLEAGVPLSSNLALWSPVGGNSLSLGQWTRIGAQMNLTVFANVSGQLDGQNFAAFSYLSALAGMPSTVLVRRHMPLASPALQELEAYKRLFQQVLPGADGRYARAGDAADRLSMDPAFAAMDVRFMGYLGMDNQEAQAFAQERLNTLASATVAAVQSGRMDEAAGSSEQAIVLMDVVGVPPQSLMEMLNVAVFTHKKAGLLERATKYEERQVRLLERGGIGEALVRVLFFLGRDELALGKHQKAAGTLARSRDYAQRIERADLEIVVLSELARAQEAGGDSAQALASYRDGLALAEKSGDTVSREEFHYNLGRVAHTRIHDEQMAATHLEAALELAKSLGEAARRNAARDALTLVLVEQQRGRLESALGTLAELLPWAEALGDKELLAQGLVYEAVVHRKLGDLPRAEQVLARAQDLAAGAGASQVLADARNARVLIRLDEGRLEEALALAEELTGEELSTETSLAAFHNLALVALELGDLARARTALERAQWFASRVGEPLAIADELLVEARVLHAQPQFARAAVEKLEQAATAYERAGHLSRKLECRIAALEWNGQGGDFDALLADAEALSRDDLRWRVLGMLGRNEEAVAFYLSSLPMPDAVLERRGLDPAAGLNLVREQVAVLAGRGEAEQALALWEQGLARRRQSLLTGQSVALDRSRGGVLIEKLLHAWAETRARRFEPRPDAEGLNELEARAGALFEQLAKESPARAAYLRPPAGVLASRRAELEPGDLLISVVSATKQSWFFLVDHESVQAVPLKLARAPLAARAGALRELLSSMARYDAELEALRALLPEEVLQRAAAAKRIVFVSDESLQGLPMQLVLSSNGVPLLYRASLAAPLRANGGGSAGPLSVLALARMPATQVSRSIPPRTDKRPTAEQEELWDQEVFEILDAAALGRYVSIPGALSGATDWRPRQRFSALWCAAQALPGRRGGGTCGGAEGSGLPLSELAAARALPGLLVLPAYQARPAEGQNLALWLEWVMDGRGVIFGTERLPVSGASYGKALIRALSAGRAPAAAQREAREAVRARWPHPAHWSSFLYYGPMD
ncbi:MAG: hypothetical protein KDH09_10825 [Chrysiogenetes bacterium]|nr:hypothetical protein [Chrysiogenetes bacterium]